MSEEITLFMWKWQHVFRVCFRSAGEKLFQQLAPSLFRSTLLVGVRRPGEKAEHPVCIDPEGGPWELGLFEGLGHEIEESSARFLKNNENIAFGSDEANTEWPARVRAGALRAAIESRMKAYDAREHTVSFCGMPSPVGSYDVVPVLHLDAAALARTSLLHRSEVPHRGQGLTRGLSEAAAWALIAEATRELSRPAPGHNARECFKRNSRDILYEAARNFMAAAEWVGDRVDAVGQLFDACNQISAMRYEGSIGLGRMVLARPGHPAVREALRLRKPVPLGQSRWARKILQMASDDISVLCDGRELYGLGSIGSDSCVGYDPGREDLFVVAFRDHHRWTLWHANQRLMQVTDGVPELAREPISQEEFTRNLRRVFKNAPDLKPDEIWRTIALAGGQKHGALIIISSLAAQEAERLANQATPVKPTLLGHDIVQRVTAIDGAVLLDLHGVCHAIGVILDGLASLDGTPARGARYNSAIRYVETRTSSAPVMAVVLSEDATLDVIPMLRPQIPRRLIQDVLAQGRELAAAPHPDRIGLWLRQLSSLRFYLNANECLEANALVEHFHKQTTAWGQIWLELEPFAPDPEMDDSYFC
ncbi:hypothetical protein D7X74_29430 [Corallococcus sp. CA047B]|uniref:diadenylate cyclase n=1 Tax=Corallococcus sp. CA047B TaxID=2316729 RepID=UPI000EA191EB|nr:diadenylate cyclase [Corallococcus sp. CA047B]RKH09520.1 hypothetical protein D7X74_29430 [Corallococcus sp. CA047B]